MKIDNNFFELLRRNIISVSNKFENFVWSDNYLSIDLFFEIDDQYKHPASSTDGDLKFFHDVDFDLN